MKKLFKLILFLVIVSSFNTAFAQTQPESASRRSIACHNRCQGDLHNRSSCATIKDQNTCDNRYVIKPNILGNDGFTCVWGTVFHGSTEPECKELNSNPGTFQEFPCECVDFYNHPSKGVPDVRGKCSSGRVNYQGLCYTSCDDNYEMKSAGICRLKGL
jgi:hypothetical protein